MDIPKLFNEDLPKKLAADPDKFRSIGGKFQINVTGAGEWNIDTAVPSIVQGSLAADVTITIAEPDAQKLIENPTANAMSLFFAGKLKVAGNQMLAMKLSALLA